MHNFMMRLYMHMLCFRYHSFDITSYILIMIIIMKFALEFAILMLLILTLCIKCTSKIHSASDCMFSNYKAKQFV